MSRYILKTFGCKANLYDGQVIEAELQKRDWSPAEDSQDVSLCIINSCTVTNEADKQGRKMAARLARENPRAKIVVTGCGAEVNPEAWARSPGVNFVVGNQNKDQLVDLVLNSSQPELSDLSTHILGTVQNYPAILSKHPLDREWPAASDSFLTPPTKLKGSSDKTRAFLKIQEGCNSFCTYCIIPYGRGPSRSLRPKEIVKQIRKLVLQGVREIIITGTNIGDYGRDWNTEPALGDLLEIIFDETQVERVRVSSLDPTEITPQILSLMAKQPRFCPHFHVSLQSPHSRILKLMKRRYSFEDVKACLDKIAEIRNPMGGVFIGMDVITGFPGETEEEFQWGLETLATLPWSRLHVFPYSERSGTPATRLPQAVAQAVRVERTKKLNSLSLNRLTQHCREVLENCSLNDLTLDHVLMEKKGKSSSWVAGYSPNYLRVLVADTEVLERNQLVSVRPVDLMIDPKNNDVALVSKVVH